MVNKTETQPTPAQTTPTQITRAQMREAYMVADQTKPLLRVNFISSADGAVTLRGLAGGMGSKTDQALMKVLRAMADIVVVGAGTVRAEGYGGINLHESDLEWRAAQGLQGLPRIAIVTNSCDIDPERSVFKKAEVKPLIITNAKADSAHLSEVADIMIAGENSVDVARLRTDLVKQGHKHILCEGGPQLFGAFLDADLVDEVCLTISPTFVGGNAERISNSNLEKDRRFKLLHALPDTDSLLYLRYSAT